MTRTRKSTLWGVGLVALALIAAPARADWMETFTGGFDQTWTFFDNSGSMPPSDSTVSTAGDKLTLTGALTASFDLNVAGLVPTESFTNVMVRATVSPSQGTTFTGAGASTNNDVFIFTRSNGIEAYLLSLDYNDGDVDLVRIDAMGGINGLASLAGAAWFNPAESYDLQLVALGTELRGRVYDTGGNLVADVLANDATLASGFSGLGSAINNDTIPQSDLTLVATMFDNVSSRAIPEPSTLLLAGLALAGVAGLRRRVKKAEG